MKVLFPFLCLTQVCAATFAKAKKVVLSVVVGLLSLKGFAANPNLSQSLNAIAQSVGQISQQLVASQGHNQQNWNKLFELQVQKQYSANDYPAWHDMQSKLNDLRSDVNQSNRQFASVGPVVNQRLTGLSSKVDLASLKLARQTINHITSKSDQDLADAVKLPLGQAWHNGLSGASQIEVLKALSAQIAVQNTLAFKQLKASQNQQLLLSRVLAELTQLNQLMAKLNTKMKG